MYLLGPAGLRTFVMRFLSLADELAEETIENHLGDAARTEGPESKPLGENPISSSIGSAEVLSNIPSTV